MAKAELYTQGLLMFRGYPRAAYWTWLCSGSPVRFQGVTQVQADMRQATRAGA